MINNFSNSYFSCTIFFIGISYIFEWINWIANFVILIRCCNNRFVVRANWNSCILSDSITICISSRVSYCILTCFIIRNWINNFLKCFRSYLNDFVYWCCRDFIRNHFSSYFFTTDGCHFFDNRADSVRSVLRNFFGAYQ